jgi:hypothetical protein
MADRLVSELGHMMEGGTNKLGRRKTFTSLEELFHGDFDDDLDYDLDYDDEVEEIRLPSGALQSRYTPGANPMYDF